VRRALAVAFALLAVAFAAHAAPFWGGKSSMPVDTDPAKLKPGEFIWAAAAIPSGPVVVVVSLVEQRAEVYRNGVRIGVSTASTGKPGHRTPTGVFAVLQKDADHHSKTYNNAPMPYTERLTWDGVALHAGGLPGYPSSHGCVHLPSEFARLLFGITRTGMTVVIADDRSAPREVAHPAALAPVDPTTGTADVQPRLAASEEDRWEPDKSPVGTLSIVISAADRRAIVLRNGIEIGRSKVRIDQPSKRFGTHALVMLEGAGSGRSPLDPRGPAHRWLAVGLPGHAGIDEQPLLDIARVHLPPDFAGALYAELAPGSTLLVTDAPVLEETTGVPIGIVNSDPA
jgi:hypothetical protein